MKKSWLCILAVICVELSRLSVIAASNEGHWVVSASGYTPTPTYEPFEMELIGSDNGQLFGTASYSDYRRERLPVTIDGVYSADGRFWPNATAEIANELGGIWKIVAYKTPPGKRAVLEVTATSTRVMLYFDLNAFRSVVGKKRFGRLVLKNGEAATFTLDHLLRPSTRQVQSVKEVSSQWDRQVQFGPPDGIVVKYPFGMLRIGSRNNEIIGSCSYVHNLPTKLEGTVDSDGEFSPRYVAQVANDPNGVWLVVGDAAAREPSKTLEISANEKVLMSVRLDIFNPMVGKYRYGRVVLENGASAVFELKNILPP